MGFDFAGTYTHILPHQRIETAFGARTAVVEFELREGGTAIRQSFDAETSHSIEQQRHGWQAILDRFARYVEARK